MVEKPTARSYSASANVQQQAGPLSWGDKCFLCGNEIGEGAPQGFYTGKRNNAMMRAHRGCLDKLDSVGGDPRDFPRADKQKLGPVPEDGERIIKGASNLSFETYADMQDFITSRGPIDPDVGVYIAGQRVQ